ncbi:hypothetical protein F4703DRAFT_1914244 [Phycomyces blakesleeanus]
MELISIFYLLHFNILNMQNIFSTKRNKFLSINSTANREFVCTICPKLKTYKILNGLRRHFNKCHPKKTKKYERIPLRRNKCNSDDSENDIPHDQPCDDLLDQYFCDDEEVMSSNGKGADFNVESDVLVYDTEMKAVFMGANPIAATMNAYLDGDNNTQTFYHQENNADDFSGYTSPFKSKAAFILHVLFHGDEDLSSERFIKKIMFAMEKLLEACEEAGEKLDFLKPDTVIYYHL